jgi:hypothetical protein
VEFQGSWDRSDVLSNAKLQQQLWVEVVVLSTKSITIICRRLEDSGRGMNMSFSDYSNVKLLGCDTYVFYEHSSRTQIK